MPPRRDSHRELEDAEELDFLGWGDRAFASEEERREAWFVHRERFLGREKPGDRPEVWWEYEAPDGPRREDYRGRHDGWTNTIVPDEEGRLTTAEFELDRLRYLAAHDLLGEEEVKELLAGSRDPHLTPYAREEAEASADAVLDGLAERDQQRRDRRRST